MVANSILNVGLLITKKCIGWLTTSIISETHITYTVKIVLKISTKIMAEMKFYKQDNKIPGITVIEIELKVYCEHFYIYFMALATFILGYKNIK